jgi:hypothetical protein
MRLAIAKANVRTFRNVLFLVLLLSVVSAPEAASLPSCDAYAYTSCDACGQYPESECDNLCNWFNTFFNPNGQCRDWVYSQSGPSCSGSGEICLMECSCAPDEY